MLEAPEDEEVAAPNGDGEPAEREQVVEPVDIPSDLPVDSAWNDIYDGASTPRLTGDAGGFEVESQRSPFLNLCAQLQRRQLQQANGLLKLRRHGQVLPESKM